MLASSINKVIHQHVCFSSFASLLHHHGHKDVKNKIQQWAQAYVGMTWCKRIDGLASCICQHDTKLKLLHLCSKVKYLEQWDPLEQDKNLKPILTVLLGADGGAQHAVAAVDDLLFKQ
jgi:hypothetical protein